MILHWGPEGDIEWLPAGHLFGKDGTEGYPLTPGQTKSQSRFSGVGFGGLEVVYLTSLCWWHVRSQNHPYLQTPYLKMRLNKWFYSLLGVARSQCDGPKDLEA